MKRYLFIAIFLPLQCLIAQDAIEWSSDMKLQLSDFKSPATEIGSTIGSLSSGIVIEFAYQMSAAQFMFTKNFNSKVLCKFNPASAAVVAPDEVTAEQLVGFAQYSFDLGELYSRKLRKQLFEAKGTFSSNDFFQQPYAQIQNQFTKEITEAGKLTNFGIEAQKLRPLHEQVLSELAAYSDFCKSCKPPKKVSNRS